METNANAQLRRETEHLHSHIDTHTFILHVFELMRLILKK